MDLQTAIEILKYHQEWRLGKRDDIKYDYWQLTEAIDVLLAEVDKPVEIDRFKCDNGTQDQQVTVCSPYQ